MTPAPDPGSPRRQFLARLAAFAAGLALPWQARRLEAAPQGTEAAQGYLGEIMLTAFNFAPKGWALCNGQLLPIAQNQGLFSLLGTQYGGNGQTTFALPDMRGRVVIHQGQGPGLGSHVIGERSGEQAHTLLLTETPAHTHVARGSSAFGTVVSPANTVVPARNGAQIPEWGVTVDTALGAVAMTNTGGSQAHENQQPYLCLNYVIALQGIFPSA
jgi:microcystin-dependent protein